MSLNTKIDHLLKSEEIVFDKVLKMLYIDNLNDVKKELNSHYTLNQTLYDGIEFTLKKLEEEEGFISRFLYKSFGLGKNKNIRRKHLILLGGQLKKDILILEQDRVRSNFFYSNIQSSLNCLIQLSEEFGKKMHLLKDEKLRNRCNNYLKKIYLKIDELIQYKKELDLRSIALEGAVEKYKNLLHRIPRYHELRNEKQLEYKRPT